MNIIFLDTETTDRDSAARLVQLAYKNNLTGQLVNEYFKPPVPISYEAMSVHHITEEMVADKPSFTESAQFTDLKKQLQENILVAHNADFDINILRNEGITTPKAIDTLNLSRHLIKSDNHKLQFLRYFLKLPIEGQAHDASGDISALEALFWHLKKLLEEKYSLSADQDILDKMFELNRTPILLEKIAFGKHRGMPFQELARQDYDYLKWLFNSELLKDISEQNRDLVYTLKHYL